MEDMLQKISAEFTKNICESYDNIYEYRGAPSEPAAGEYAGIRDRAISAVIRDLVAMSREGGSDPRQIWQEYRDDILSNTIEPLSREMKKQPWFSQSEFEKEVASFIDGKLAPEQEITEDRPTNAFGFISQLKTHPMVDKIVNIQGQSDGYTALIRTKDGNAYEIDIRPASLSKKHIELTGKKP